MPHRINKNPLGEVEIPALGHLIVKAGDVFEDPDDLLKGQDAIYPTTNKKPATPAADTQPEG